MKQERDHAQNKGELLRKQLDRYKSDMENCSHEKTRCNLNENLTKKEAWTNTNR